MSLPTPCYLEDFVVGERFISDFLVVSEAEIIAFAKKFDPQPFHTDPVAAVNTALHGLAASGWHTAAMTMSLFVASGPKPAGGLIGAGVEALEWPIPVRPGDTLHLESEVISIRESRTKPAGIVTVRATTLNQHGNTVQIFQPKLFIPKRPTAEHTS
ncbi:MAG: MaoC family dehydratase [Gemmatimonadaceae bacterium]